MFLCSYVLMFLCSYVLMFLCSYVSYVSYVLIQGRAKTLTAGGIILCRNVKCAPGTLLECQGFSCSTYGLLDVNCTGGDCGRYLYSSSSAIDREGQHISSSQHWHKIDYPI